MISESLRLSSFDHSLHKLTSLATSRSWSMTPRLYGSVSHRAGCANTFTISITSLARVLFKGGVVAGVGDHDFTRELLPEGEDEL
ncbi:MAG: hypothetical protein ACYDHP_06940 [Ferrimicrobium sp.]